MAVGAFSDYLKDNWMSLAAGAAGPWVGKQFSSDGQGSAMQDSLWGAGLGAAAKGLQGKDWQSGIIPGAGAGYLSGGVQNKFFNNRDWSDYGPAPGAAGMVRGSTQDLQRIAALKQTGALNAGDASSVVKNRLLSGVGSNARGGGGGSGFLGGMSDQMKWGLAAGLGTYALTSGSEEDDIDKIRGANEAAGAPILDNEVKYEQARITKERELGRPLTKSEERDLRLSFGLDRDPPIPMNTGTREDPKYARSVADGGYIQGYQEGGEVQDEGLSKELYQWETFLNGKEPSEWEWMRAQERHGMTPSASDASRDAMQQEAIQQFIPSDENFDTNGGYARGPGGPKDDMIDAKLSDGEFVLTADAVQGAGGPGPLYEMMDQLEGRV